MSEKESQELVAQADALYNEQELDAALQLYREVIAVDSEQAWAHSRIGAILAQQGDLEGAEASLTIAVQLNPKLGQAHSNLGNVSYTRGDYQGALECYKRALDLDGDNPIYHENLHAAYKKLGKVSEAVHHLKRSYSLRRQSDRAEARQKLKGVQSKMGCLGKAVMLMAVLMSATLLIF